MGKTKKTAKHSKYSKHISNKISKSTKNISINEDDILNTFTQLVLEYIQNPP